MPESDRSAGRASLRRSHSRRRSTITGPIPDIQYQPVHLEKKYELVKYRPTQVASPIYISDTSTKPSNSPGIVRPGSRKLSHGSLPTYETRHKSYTLDNSTIGKRRSVVSNSPSDCLIIVSDEGSRIPVRNKTNDNVPLVTGIPCEPPAEFLREVDKSEKKDQGPVLLRTLEKQKQEASQLAEDHAYLKSTEWAKELSKLADRAAYSIALFNRRQRHRRPIPYRFEWVNLPQCNINVSVSKELLEVHQICGSNYYKPVDSPGSLTTYVQLDFFYPSTKKAQRLRSDWVNNPGKLVFYVSEMRFGIDLYSGSYARFLEAGSQLQATVLYNRGTMKRSGILGTTTFSINELLHRATINVAGDLIDPNGSVNGRLELQLRQHLPVNGKVIDVVRKPWLFLAVPEIPYQDFPTNGGDVLRKAKSVQNITNLNGFANGDESHHVAPSDIIEALEKSLSYNNGHAIKLSAIGTDMEELFSQWEKKPDENQLDSYCDNLLRLLQQFQQKREECEKCLDTKGARYYSKRAILILEELHRYKVHLVPREKKEYNESKNVIGNGINETGKTAFIPVNQSKRHTVYLDETGYNRDVVVVETSRQNKANTLPNDITLKRANSRELQPVERVVKIPERSVTENGYHSQRKPSNTDQEESLIIYVSP